MDKLLNKTMEFLYKNEKMDEEQASIIKYGLEILILKIIFFSAMLIVGLLLRSFWECLFFMALFIPLRTNAGGYHAKTRMQCFVQSILMTSVIIIMVKISNLYTYAVISLLAFAVIAIPFIWILAPIDTKNKRLDEDERRIFKKRTRIILIAEALTAIVLWFINLKSITCTVMIVFIAVFLLMAVEDKKNKAIT